MARYTGAGSVLRFHLRPSGSGVKKGLGEDSKKTSECGKASGGDGGGRKRGRRGGIWRFNSEAVTWDACDESKIALVAGDGNEVG